jgi:hypothetical protein
MCVVAWDSVVAPHEPGSFQFELDVPVAPTVGEGEAREVAQQPVDTPSPADSPGQELREASYLGEVASH